MADKQVPQDVMVEIFLKLPVKSLMRFKCLNKSYHALITKPSFVKEHFELMKSHPGMLVFDGEGGFSTKLLSDEMSQPANDLELPQLSDNNVAAVIPYGPCNGIFCLDFTYHDRTSQLCLWNPTTREVKVLPSPQHHICSIGESLVHGFGVVPGTNDYKVVRLFSTMDFDRGISKLFSVEVYNLSTNSWRKIDITESACTIYTPMFSSYLNGVYHWLTLPFQAEAIVCFDMSNDSFSKMKLPTVFDDFSTLQALMNSNIAVVNDSIAYIMEYSILNSLDSSIEIWVMNEYGVEASWNKRYVIGPYQGLWNFMGFWEEDEILVGQDNQPLVSYNPDADQVEEFPVRVGLAYMFQAFKYVGSIFSLSVLNELE